MAIWIKIFFLNVFIIMLMFPFFNDRVYLSAVNFCIINFKIHRRSSLSIWAVRFKVLFSVPKYFFQNFWVNAQNLAGIGNNLSRVNSDRIRDKVCVSEMISNLIFTVMSLSWILEKFYFPFHYYIVVFTCITFLKNIVWVLVVLLIKSIQQLQFCKVV